MEHQILCHTAAGQGCNLVFQLFAAHQVVLIFIHLHRIAEGAGRTRDNGDLRNRSGMALQCCDECMADLVIGNDQFLFVGHDLILLLVSGDDNLNALLQIRLGDEFSSITDSTECCLVDHIGKFCTRSTGCHTCDRIVIDIVAHADVFRMDFQDFLTAF